MATTRRRVLAAMAAAFVAPLAGAQDPRAATAQQAARDWLAIADKFDTEGSYQAAGAKFRQALPPERWVAAMQYVREPLGEVVQRSVASTQFTNTIEGQPVGDYALIVFRTAWKNKTLGRELVALEVEGYRWHVVGYTIQ